MKVERNKKRENKGKRKETKARRRNRKELGRKAEEISANYLEENGYRIISRNLRTREWEIDIVAISPEDVLCIVEVRSIYLRGTKESCIPSSGKPQFSSPIETITSRKIKKIVSGCNYIIQKLRWQGKVRFDVIEVIFEDGKYRINHIKEAFYPPL